MIVLTGGGTGGHLCVVKSLLNAFKAQGEPCIFIGSKNGKDSLYFSNEEDFSEKYFLNTSAVVGKKPKDMLKSLSNIIKESFFSIKLLKEFDIKAVISVGGYSSAPASLASKLCFKPLFIHEQNARAGLLNTIFKPLSKGYFSSFEEIFCSYPVGEEFYKKARLRKELKSVIFLGGSNGASFINDLAMNMAIILKQNNIKIIHQSGEKDFEKCKAWYEKIGLEVDLFSFYPSLVDKMQKADLAVSRAGASTLFELAANALPAVFIPYPYAHKNHQYYNAKYLKDKGLCEIFMQDNIIENDLFKYIFNMDIKKISEQLPGVNSFGGAEFLAKYVLNSLKSS